MRGVKLSAKVLILDEPTSSLDRHEVECAWYVALVVGLSAVDVDDHAFLGFGKGFDFFDADVGEFAGQNGRGDNYSC